MAEGEAEGAVNVFKIAPFRIGVAPRFSSQGAAGSGQASVAGGKGQDGAGAVTEVVVPLPPVNTWDRKRSRSAGHVQVDGGGSGVSGTGDSAVRSLKRQRETWVGSAGLAEIPELYSEAWDDVVIFSVRIVTHVCTILAWRLFHARVCSCTLVVTYPLEGEHNTLESYERCISAHMRVFICTRVHLTQDDQETRTKDLDEWLSHIIAQERAQRRGVDSISAAVGGAACTGTAAITGAGGVPGSLVHGVAPAGNGVGQEEEKGAEGKDAAGAGGTVDGNGDGAVSRAKEEVGAMGTGMTIRERLLQIRLALPAAKGTEAGTGDEGGGCEWPSCPGRAAKRARDGVAADGAAGAEVGAPVAGGSGSNGGHGKGGQVRRTGRLAWDGGGTRAAGCFAIEKLDVENSSASTKSQDEYKISWRVHLFPGGFSIEGQNEAHAYDMTAKAFLTALDAGRLPADVTMDTPSETTAAFEYYDGCILAEVRGLHQLHQYFYAC